MPCSSSLGDVMGHGVAAALVMAGVRAVLRDRAAAAGEPGGADGPAQPAASPPTTAATGS